jgi:hypothetical protein
MQNTCIHTHTYTKMRKNTHTNMHQQTNSYTCTMYTCIYTYIHTTNIYIHTHPRIYANTRKDSHITTTQTIYRRFQSQPSQEPLSISATRTHQSATARSTPCPAATSPLWCDHVPVYQRATATATATATARTWLQET